MHIESSIMFRRVPFFALISANHRDDLPGGKDLVRIHLGIAPTWGLHCQFSELEARELGEALIEAALAVKQGKSYGVEIALPIIGEEKCLPQKS